MAVNVSPCSVLVVDDEEPIGRLLQKELATPTRQVRAVGSLTEARALCEREPFDALLLDVRLPDGNGLDLLPFVRRCCPQAKVVVMTGYADVELAVRAMREGAYDFVTKPFTLEKLEVMLCRALEHARLERENAGLRFAAKGNTATMVGHTTPVQQVRLLVEKVAPTDVPVLITGASGTGKDVTAEALHRASLRAAMPFVVKNCAGLQPELARAELFGHAKGAFTHAVSATEGLLSHAHRGTLFLDEVGELSLDVQAQLLRVLENKRYRRVGEKEERHADVRFLFATNRDLAEEVAHGRFHEALFHRINVFRIHLPPLAQRQEDIPALVSHFLAMLHKGPNAAQVTPEAMAHLLAYGWPGNIRELRNVMERGLILAEQGVITPDCLPQELLRGPLAETSTTMAGMHGSMPQAPQQEPAPSAVAVNAHEGLSPLAAMELRHIQAVLESVHGNKRQAALLLGISRKTLYRKLALLLEP